ncbi:MAG: glycosyltransferase family 4 protein [Terrimicrobiaceae bacterium]
MKAPFHATISVWNDFWVPELCEGLARGGYEVLALRSEHAAICGVQTQTCEVSRILTRLFQRTQQPFLLEAAQDWFEAFARRRVGQSPVFWGWNGHNLSSCLAAQRCGQRIICERGSTHGAWAARRLNEVHKQLGWGPTDLGAEKRELRAIREYELAEKIIVPSQFVKKTFLEEGMSEEKLHVNPYGVDVEHWGRISGTERSNGPLIFVFTASMTPRKGVHILLRAWEKAGLNDAELWLCGGVHFPIKALGLPVGKNVRFLGYTSHEKLIDIYNRASVYLLPSFEEGMARSGLEAMAAGLPLIVTEETGLTDVMIQGVQGWVVPSGNVEALAETLRIVAGSRDRLSSMSIACQATGCKYTKSAYGHRAAQFLRDFLK